MAIAWLVPNGCADQQPASACRRRCGSGGIIGQRWLVFASAEDSDRGTDRRFGVTNRSGARVLLQPTLDDYAGRRETDNRHRKSRCDLAMDRRSGHRFVANDFRLYLQAAARYLPVRPRWFIAEPLSAQAPQAEWLRRPANREKRLWVPTRRVCRWRR